MRKALPMALDRCPATPDGRLPPDEISDCEFCVGTAFCQGTSDDPPALGVMTEAEWRAHCEDES